MKRILIFSLAYYPRVGGAEIAIKEITDRISPSEIAFHMVTMRFSKEDAAEEKIGNVFVHRVGKNASYLSKIFFIPRTARLARQLHAQARFDAAWAMMSYMTLPIIFSRTKLPYALTLQEGDTESHMFARLRILPFLYFINRGFREARVIQAISNYLGAWARHRGFTGLLEIIPNGVNTHAFAGDSVPHDGTVLITTSRLVHKNAVDDIIRALALLPASTRLVIAGSGPDEQKLKTLAGDLGVFNRITFLGYVEQSRLPALLHTADIFIRPSRSEGMGNSFIEAMAAGLPVIATQEGGIADFLFDAKRNPVQPPTGFAVDKDSPEQIAEVVKTILANPAEVQKVIQNAQAMVRQKYEWDLLAKDMQEKVFARVLKTG